MIPAEKKFYLTKEGFDRLKKEFDELKRLRMSVIKDSDNQDDLVFINKRMEDVSNIIQSHEIIKLPARDKRDVVGLGATVVVECGDRRNEFTIVGTLEANPLKGWISNESPVGQALLGKKVGDFVLVHASSQAGYMVKSVIYDFKKGMGRA